MMEVGGFFSDFEAVRTRDAPRRHAARHRPGRRAAGLLDARRDVSQNMYRYVIGDLLHVAAVRNEKGLEVLTQRFTGTST